MPKPTTAALVAVALGALAASCAGGGQPGKGMSVPSATAASVASSASPSSRPTPITPGRPAVADASFPKGSGTYVYDTGGIYATVQFPANFEDPAVADFRQFQLRSGCDECFVRHLATVTVTNRTGLTFSTTGFALLLSSRQMVRLYPLSAYVSAALAQVRPTQSDTLNLGSMIIAESPTTIGPAQHITTVVATAAPVAAFQGVQYSDGSSLVQLQPVWKLREAAVKAARTQARVSAALARRQARLAAQARRRAGHQPHRLTH